jgi:two-component system nitrogen regulation response regulator GlnG
MNLAAHNPQTPVWIIDDDQSMRWVLDKTLSNNGYQVSAFESGSVALASFKRTPPSERPSLIITDVRMPGINGFELLKQIKNISPQTPIIVMTAYTDLDTTVQAFHEGAFEYLPKPFDIDDALELVARACEPVVENGADVQRLPSEIGHSQVGGAGLRKNAARLRAGGNTGAQAGCRASARLGP